MSDSAPLPADVRLRMQDIPGMTVQMHHELCIGLLAQCYEHVPIVPRLAIHQGCEAARLMGLPIEPNRLGTSTGLFSGGRA